MAVDQALLDYYPLEELTTEDGTRTYRGLLVAAQRDMVEAQLQAVTDAGLQPVMVDLTAFAVLRSLADSDDLGMGSTMEALIDVGARVTNIVVHEGGVPRFVRILLMGGADVTDALAERTGSEQTEAEALKQRWACRPTTTTPRPQAAGRVMEAAGQAFIDQVRGSLDYYTASPGARPIERIVVTGGGSRLGGLAERLVQLARGSRSSAAPPSASCRSARPASAQNRWSSSSRWPPCRWAWPSEAPHDHVDANPPGADATGQPAAAGDRGSGQAAPPEAHARAAGSGSHGARRRLATSSPAARLVVPRSRSAEAQAEDAQLQADVATYAEVPQVLAEVDVAQANLVTAMTPEIRWSFYLNDLSLTIPRTTRLTSMTAVNAAADAQLSEHWQQRTRW